MTSKNRLIIGRGLFTIFIIVAFGIIVMNEKGGELFKDKAEEKINTYLESNYQDIINKVDKEEIKYEGTTYTKKITSKANKNLFFYIKYNDKKLTDTYKQDYVEGKTLFKYLNSNIEKTIKDKTKINCKVNSIAKLNNYSEKVQERIIKEDNLLELKYYYIETEIQIKDWNKKEITKEITSIIQKMQTEKITPKYYVITITKADDITTSIRISNITEDFISLSDKEEIIDDILNNKETNRLEKNKITYKYEN